MSRFNKCLICKEYHFSVQCLPTYLVYHDEYSGDEEHIVRAYSLEDAAEKYAKNYNEDDGEYSMMDGGDITVRVVNPRDTAEEMTFTVSAEPDIYYSCSEVE